MLQAHLITSAGADIYVEVIVCLCLCFAWKDVIMFCFGFYSNNTNDVRFLLNVLTMGVNKVQKTCLLLHACIRLICWRSDVKSFFVSMLFNLASLTLNLIMYEHYKTSKSFHFGYCMFQSITKYCIYEHASSVHTKNVHFMYFGDYIFPTSKSKETLIELWHL